MKVKCINIYNEHTNEYEEESSWITIGKEYIVLAIEIRLDEVSFLIASDPNEQPVLQNALQFEILSKKIPSTWEIGPDSFALFTLEPKSWQAPGFWEKCYDHHPDELEIYKREVRIILAEENEL